MRELRDGNRDDEVNFSDAVDQQKHLTCFHSEFTTKQFWDIFMFR